MKTTTAARKETIKTAAEKNHTAKGNGDRRVGEDRRTTGKEEVMKTNVKEATKKVVPEEHKPTPLELARKARPTNALGHIIGAMSEILDKYLMTGKFTVETLEKKLVKEHGLKEKPAHYRVKSHIEHLETEKKGLCKVERKDGHLLLILKAHAAH